MYVAPLLNYGLRSYNGEQETIWEPEHPVMVNLPSSGPPMFVDWQTCEHEWGDELSARTSSGGLNGTIANGKGQATNREPLFVASGCRFCQKCGAWYGAYGSEPTPSLYVWHTVLICRAIQRVLRDDGTLWWNLGDSFAGSNGNGWKQTNADTNRSTGLEGNVDLRRLNGRTDDVPEKNLLLIPFRVAIALQADGWWIRQVIIWNKSSPMPESVDDRPTTSHEYIFLLAKSPRYFYDGMAVRVPGSEQQTRHNRHYAHEYNVGIQALSGGQPGNVNNVGIHSRPGIGGHNLYSVWSLGYEPQSDALCHACGAYYQGKAWTRLKTRVIDGKPQRICSACGEVDWVSHFAAYPSTIPRTAFLAGTSEHGVCPTCGAPWERVTERVDAPVQNPRHFSKMGQADRQDSAEVYTETLIRTVGWEPTCSCYDLPPKPPAPDPIAAISDPELIRLWNDALAAWRRMALTCPVIPGTVLDPFLGSGTSLIVARQLGRKGIGIDISQDYLNLAGHRLTEQPMSLFAQIEESTQEALL